MTFSNNSSKWKTQIKTTNSGWKNSKSNVKNETSGTSTQNTSIPYQNKISSINVFTSHWLDLQRFTLIIFWRQLSISKRIFLKISMWRVRSASFTRCLFIILCCRRGRTRRMLRSWVRRCLFIWRRSLKSILLHEFILRNRKNRFSKYSRLIHNLLLILRNWINRRWLIRSKLWRNQSQKFKKQKRKFHYGSKNLRVEMIRKNFMNGKNEQIENFWSQFARQMENSYVLLIIKSSYSSILLEVETTRS